MNPATRAPLGVGIVGLSARGGWAASSHIPAIAALPDLELRALCGHTAESSAAACTKYGVPASIDVARMCERDDVDLVVVTVNAARHRELVEPALRAGKPVLCEWPLGTNLADTRELSSMATEFGTFARVGLQGRAAPTVRFVRDLVSDGYVGRVLSTSVIGSGRAWGPTFKRQQAYTLDCTSGSTMLNIPMGHTIDALTVVLGEIDDVAAVSANLRPEVREVESGMLRGKTSEDQMAVAATLTSGAVASIHYRGGSARGINFCWEISGTEGELLITGDTGHLQLASLRVEGARGDEGELALLPVPARYELVSTLHSNPSTPAYNLAHSYLDVITDLRESTSNAPDFGHALRRKATLAAIACAAESGQRMHIHADDTPPVSVVTH